MSVVKVPTSFNIELEFEIPNFFKRLFALAIDIAIEIFYLYLMSYALSAIGNGGSKNDFYDSWAWSLILLLPIMTYHFIFEITMNGQSIGKKIMKLRVVDEKGGKASFSQFAIRWLLRISDVWMFLLLALLIQTSLYPDAENTFVTIIGFTFLITDIFLVMSSKKGQRIGDLLAHTIIISTNAKSNIAETIFEEVATNYIVQFPQVMRLSDKDLNAIKTILRAARKKSDYEMAENAAFKVKNYLDISDNRSAYDFLDVLLKDYNYLSLQ